MVYMGSKNKYCKYIVPIIQQYINKNNIITFIDCFCGGANLADKIKCETVICNDLSPTLIALHQQAQKDFSKIPNETFRLYWDVAKKDWEKIKNNIKEQKEYDKDLQLPLVAIGAIEWYGSFSAGGFPKGYANPDPIGKRNRFFESYNNHKKQSENENYKKIKFVQGDYKDLIKKYNCNNSTLLYCDSPYKGTKPYGISPNFNFQEYYNWLLQTSKICPIFISEQNLPSNFNQYIVWEKDDVVRTVGKDNNFKACEKLYFIDNRKEET